MRHTTLVSPCRWKAGLSLGCSSYGAAWPPGRSPCRCWTWCSRSTGSWGPRRQDTTALLTGEPLSLLSCILDKEEHCYTPGTQDILTCKCRGGWRGFPGECLTSRWSRRCRWSSRTWWKLDVYETNKINRRFNRIASWILAMYDFQPKGNVFDIKRMQYPHGLLETNQSNNILTSTTTQQPFKIIMLTNAWKHEC